MVQGPLAGQQFPYQGIRVTPNVYTTLEEIDTFASAIEEVLKSGLPSAPRTGARAHFQRKSSVCGSAFCFEHRQDIHQVGSSVM
jgi:hypothetical protein